MANVVKLGRRPKAFKEISVHLTLPDGSEGLIPVTFKYMEKTEYGAWKDKLAAVAKTLAKDGEFSWEAVYEASGSAAVDALLEVIESWGLDEPLGRDALLQLGEECGAGAFPALFEAFGRACLEGRLGN